MQLFQHLTLALLAISTVASAMSSTSNTISIPISKKRDAFTLADSNEVDFGKTAAHIHGITAKYQMTLAHFKTNRGKIHPLASTSNDVKKRSSGAISLTAAVQNTVWHGAISIGSTTVQCDFDTGSADIVINPSAYTPDSSA